MFVSPSTVKDSSVRSRFIDPVVQVNLDPVSASTRSPRMLPVDVLTAITPMVFSRSTDPVEVLMVSLP